MKSRTWLADLRLVLLPVTPRAGGRIVKTCAAILLSVMTARVMHLAGPQFAGIVSILAVQPSVYRSLRHGFRQLISAMMGAMLGVAALYGLGDSAFAMALVALLLMGLHARWGWTQSLLIAVVIAINTIGSRGLSPVASGLTQFGLVAIGIGYGNVLNLLFKPRYGARSHSILGTCTRDVFRLMVLVHKDMERAVPTPYVVFRRQLDKVKRSLDHGKMIAGYFQEDVSSSDLRASSVLASLDTLESMVERTRDLSKTLQRAGRSADRDPLIRLSYVILRLQRRMIWGKACHFQFVDAACRCVERRCAAAGTSLDFVEQATMYQMYTYLGEYYESLRYVTSGASFWHGNIFGFRNLPGADRLVERYDQSAESSIAHRCTGEATRPHGLG